MPEKKFVYLPEAVDHGENPSLEKPNPSIRPAAPEVQLPEVDMSVSMPTCLFSFSTNLSISIHLGER